MTHPTNLPIYQSTNLPPPNPYVGPRTFSYEQRHLFFGREREARDLLARVLSERLLLFYAQSGAGKSSLLNTRLIPSLQEDKGFMVLPVARVSGELPAGVAQVNNIFAFNLMLSIVAESDPARLAGVTLSDFLARLALRPAGDGQDPARREWVYDAAATPAPATPNGRRYALIVDQFEEVITSHPGRWQEREAFFRQLDAAMQADPNLWVVLSLREDYVAALDPYAPLVFNRLRARFYMERMDGAAALEAIRRPAELGGRPFAAGVAEQLVDNLRQVRVPGQATTVAGQYVEPVQLQVVCYQLWEKLHVTSGRVQVAGGGQDVRSTATPEAAMQPESLVITETDLREAGNVDQALTAFYEETLAAALADPAAVGVSERQVRAWFDDQLITEAGTRGLVHQGERESGGLPNGVVRALQRRFLVRGEARGSDVWIELVHDRFVEPIRQSNRAWFAKHQKPVTLASKEWKDAGRPNSRLYTRAQLIEVQAQFEANPAEFEEIEAEFIRASGVENNRIRTRRRIVVVGLAAALGVSVLVAWLALQIARSNAMQAGRDRVSVSQDFASTLANRSTRLLADYPQRGLLLALEAEGVSADSLPPFPSPSADIALHDALRIIGGTPLVGHTDKIVDATFSPDGRWLATASLDGSTRLTDLTQAITRTQQLAGQGGALSDLEFSPDSKSLATASVDGTFSLWSLEHLENPPTLVAISEYPLSSLAFSPDSHQVAVSVRVASWTSDEPCVLLWDTTGNTAVQIVPSGDATTVSTLRFSPDGQWLAGISAPTQSDSGKALLWKTSQLSSPPLEVSGSTYTDKDGNTRNASVSAIDFNPEGHLLAVADDHGVTTILELDQIGEDSLVHYLSVPNSASIRSMSFGPDHKLLMTTHDDGSVQLWDVSKYQALTTPTILKAGEHPLVLSAIDATGTWLAVGSDYGVVNVWNLKDPSAAPLALHGHELGITALAFHPTKAQILTASEDSFARLWDLPAPLVEPVVLRGFRDTVSDLAFSQEGQKLATASLDGTLTVWDVDQPEAGSTVLYRDRFSPLRTVAVSPDGNWLAAAGDNGKVMLWPGMDGNTVPTTLPVYPGIVYDLAFSSDSQVLAVASEDGAVRLWDIAKDLEKPWQVIELAQGSSRSVAFSPDGTRLAIGSSTGEVQIRNLEDWQTIAHSLKGSDGRVLALAFSPDSTQLAAVGEDSVVRVWAVQDFGKDPLVLRGHESGIGAVSFSPDRSLLATGGYDQTTRLWDMSRVRATSGILTGHQGEVRTVSFSPDGRWLATGGVDRTVQLWINSVSWLRQIACETVGRNLSEEEWALYFPGMAYKSTCANWLPKPRVITTAAKDEPTRASYVALDLANTARLRQYPRPPLDNGRGLHFHLDLRDELIALTVERLQSIDARWTTIYAENETQALRAAKACWDAGVMPVVRIGVTIDQPFDPVPWVEDLLREGIPPYVQLYNEPEDTREWREMALSDDWKNIFGRNWARQAVRVYDAGGYPGLQVLDKESFAAAVDAVRGLGRMEIWDRAFFVQHNYGLNHPPAYPFDEVSQQSNPGMSVADDQSSILSFLVYARWMQETLGFVLPIIGGEGGWLPSDASDPRYPRIDPGLHATYHAEMFDWFRIGVLSNGEPLPDYLFSVTPWLASSWTFGGQNWWDNPLMPDGKLTETIEAVRSIPPFVRRFSWD